MSKLTGIPSSRPSSAPGGSKTAFSPFWSPQHAGRLQMLYQSLSSCLILLVILLVILFYAILIGFNELKSALAWDGFQTDKGTTLCNGWLFCHHCIFTWVVADSVRQNLKPSEQIWTEHLGNIGELFHTISTYEMPHPLDSTCSSLETHHVKISAFCSITWWANWLEFQVLDLPLLQEAPRRCSPHSDHLNMLVASKCSINLYHPVRSC